MTTATRRSLTDVPDILYNVFSHFDVHAVWYDDNRSAALYDSRRSLAMAARTCRAFTNPALKMLWSSLPDDQPLADLLCTLGIATRERDLDSQSRHDDDKPQRYLLPTDDVGGYPDFDAIDSYERRWKRARRYDVDYSISTPGDPRTHVHWARFVQYASRVRAVALFIFDGPKWSRLWDELQHATGGITILPMLDTVTFCEIGPRRALTPGIFALIPPSVGKLRLPLPPSRLDPSMIRTYFPQIRHMDVQPECGVEDLRMLAGFPTLRCLSISVSFAVPSPNLTLPVLGTLVMEGSWPNLTTLLNSAHLPSLHTLSVTGWEGEDNASKLAMDAIQCFHAISRYKSITYLSIYTIHTPQYQDGCVEPDIPEVEGTFDGTLLDTMRPLLSLRSLRYLTTRLPDYLVGTESDLSLMADAWPDLVELHLVIWVYQGWSRAYTPRPERPYGGRLEGIAHFAGKCPRLRVLHLPAMEIAEESLGAVEFPSETHDLQTLVIEKVLFPYGRADLAGQMSELVRRVFPRVASAFEQDQIRFGKEEFYFSDDDSDPGEEEEEEGQETWGFVKGASGRCDDCTKHMRLRWRVAW
ncbi:hypothetical protein DICSQDRAFT_136564 [Dichomitus squalens LYAD-421 SS1]|uniref:F-box domain-containing protein n=1 Tax=Dichomitus squalens (strain LYAD-421) TaxID=732165 RepID=R7SYT7_DICSQ|nr:uncharacterized protein DICSQDRAFT_136564 [Dichomitus squalens LYAD-421 SS1]EJF61349.1 hypothetical protein DICSQDRAFT_136564 [Dichomitus squalens LYAD-421 SS1]